MPTNHFPYVGTHFKTHLGFQRDGNSFGSYVSNRGESALLVYGSKGDSVPLREESNGGQSTAEPRNGAASPGEPKGYQTQPSDVSPSLWKCNRLLFRKILQVGVEDFFNGSVANILTNEVYLGKIRWRREPVKRVAKEGMLSKKRILNDDYELYEGRHEAIITEEQWDRVQEILNRHKHTSNHTERQ